MRYERLNKRTVRPFSKEEAQSRDYAQIENIHQAGPIAMADHLVINESTVGYLYRQMDEIIGNIKIKE